jgi:hypothetical protein
VILRRLFLSVIAGLDPAIQGRRRLDARIKSTAVRFSASWRKFHFLHLPP